MFDDDFEALDELLDDNNYVQKQNLDEVDDFQICNELIGEIINHEY